MWAIWNPTTYLWDQEKAEKIGIVCVTLWLVHTSWIFLVGLFPFHQFLKVVQRDEGTIERCKLKTLQKMHMVQVQGFCAVCGMTQYGMVTSQNHHQILWDSQILWDCEDVKAKTVALHGTTLCFNWSLALLPASSHPWFPSAQYLAEYTGSEVSCLAFLTPTMCPMTLSQEWRTNKHSVQQEPFSAHLKYPNTQIE